MQNERDNIASPFRHVIQEYTRESKFLSNQLSAFIVYLV